MRVCLLCQKGRRAHLAKLQVADLVCTQRYGLHTTASMFECRLTVVNQYVLSCIWDSSMQRLTA
jgi:hypothetical protein